MSLCFTSASNGGLRSAVVHISTLWPVCFLGRWIKEAMGWGRCCCLRERMKRRFITPQHHGARTHTQSQSGLVISSSPSSGGSERLQAPLSDYPQLPLHSSRRLSACGVIHGCACLSHQTPTNALHSSEDAGIVEQLSPWEMEGQCLVGCCFLDMDPQNTSTGK